MIEILALVIALALLGLAAALRAAGASLVRTPRADALHDQAEGDTRAGRVSELLEEPARIQPALGTVHSLLLVAAALPAAWAFSERLDGARLVVALLALGVFLVLFGDVLPRSWGRSHPRTLAYRLVPLLAVAVRLGGRAVDLVVEDGGAEPAEGDDDEHDEEERELISSVLEFTDAIVREIMVPRPDMVMIDGNADTDVALDLVLAEGVSRVPVIRDGPDDIHGVLYAKDLLRLHDAGEEAKACSQIARAAYFVPETKRISSLLRDMQAEQVHMAIVVDEFGGTAGLVTIEDIIEELVGEIADEYDVEEPMVTPLEDGGYLIDARLGVDDLRDLLEVELPGEGWDTVGGLMLGLAGRVPKEGEAFDFDEIRLTADRVQGRRVARVRASRL